MFAHRGNGIVPIAIQPNKEFPTEVWVERQSADSITFGLADPGYGLSVNLKIFYDPKTYFPRRIVRFAPVRVQRIRATGSAIALLGTDGKLDFTAQERNGAWHVTTSSAIPTVARPPLASVAQIAPMPVSTISEVEVTRPDRVRHIPEETPMQVVEKIGPYERTGKKIWVGKTFFDGDGSIGIGSSTIKTLNLLK